MDNLKPGDMYPLNIADKKLYEDMDNFEHEIYKQSKRLLKKSKTLAKRIKQRKLINKKGELQPFLKNVDLGRGEQVLRVLNFSEE